MKNFLNFFYMLLASLLFAQVCYAGKLSAIEGHRDFIGKPHAPVEIQFTLPEKIASTHKLKIHVALQTTRDADALDVELHFDEGLQGVSRERLHFGYTASKHANQFDIECIPHRDGLFYVRLLATLTINGEQQSRSFIIPVNVGNADARKTLKSSGDVKQDASGDRVISMPAQESRRPAK